jgi:hypothetical protein
MLPPRQGIVSSVCELHHRSRSNIPVRLDEPVYLQLQTEESLQRAGSTDWPFAEFPLGSLYVALSNHSTPDWAVSLQLESVQCALALQGHRELTNYATDDPPDRSYLQPSM